MGMRTNRDFQTLCIPWLHAMHSSKIIIAWHSVVCKYSRHQQLPSNLELKFDFDWFKAGFPRQTDPRAKITDVKIHSKFNLTVTVTWFICSQGSLPDSNKAETLCSLFLHCKQSYSEVLILLPKWCCPEVTDYLMISQRNFSHCKKSAAQTFLWLVERENVYVCGVLEIVEKTGMLI